MGRLYFFGCFWACARPISARRRGNLLGGHPCRCGVRRSRLPKRSGWLCQFFRGTSWISLVEEGPSVYTTGRVGVFILYANRWTGRRTGEFKSTKSILKMTSTQSSAIASAISDRGFRLLLVLLHALLSHCRSDYTYQTVAALLRPT